MTEDKTSQAQEGNGVEGAQHPASSTGSKNLTADSSNHRGGFDRSDKRRANNRANFRNFLARLTLNVLTLLVAVASLFVSYFTYKNAADTSDLKSAVGNLTKLAREAQEQAVAMQAQAVAMQGQLEESVAGQRPWVTIIPTVVNFSMSEFVTTKSRSVTLAVNFAVHNSGREPAQNIQIQWGMMPYVGNPRTVRDVDGAQDAQCREAKRLSDLPNVEGITVLPATEQNQIQSSGVFNRDIGDQSFFLIYGCVDYSYSPDRHGESLVPIYFGKA